MTLNVELLTKVKEHILAHPEQLEMDDWACGTQACIAGHACMLSGERIYDDGGVPYVRLPNGEEVDVADRGGELLGRGYEYMQDLFYRHVWKDRKDDQAYSEAESDVERAAITARVIDKYIASCEGAA